MLKSYSMARTRERKKKYLNSQNAQEVANRGMNAAFTQAHGVLEKGDDGKWSETRGYTRTRSGRMSANGKNTKGALTWTFTEKDENGNTVRQSGRSRIASRRQREYDVRNAMNNDQRSPEAIQRLRDMGIAVAYGSRVTTG